MKEKTKRILEKVKEIIRQYDTRLTLRQIYYRLVSKQVIENNVNEYKRLSSILVKARMEGIINFDSIEDRSRDVNIDTEESAESKEVFLSRELNWLEEWDEGYSGYSLPRWHNQPYSVEVWVEKQALESLFLSVTRERRVNLAVCKGYPSLTYLYQAAKRLIENNDKKRVVLYFGDHDPSGKDIERYIKERLNDLEVGDIEIKRIALTMGQVQEYKLPPAPTKKGDSRSSNYIAKYGDNSIELDAIEPDILQEIIKEAIGEYFDKEIHEEVKEESEESREWLEERMSKVGDTIKNIANEVREGEQ